jgi:hypothetical protein
VSASLPVIVIAAILIIAAILLLLVRRPGAPGRPYTASCTRVYADAASEAHLLAPGQEPGPWQATTPALCGTVPDYGCVWLGMRSAGEAAEAKGRVLCARCGRIAAGKDKTQRREERRNGRQ